jgi:dipeptidyl aminopeptidase/acylaminoacyl peptidase
MNTLLSRRLGGFLLAASLLSLWACKQDPQSANGSSPLALHTSSTPAHPEIVYYVTQTSSHNLVGIWVMDSTGANATCIYSTSSASNLFYPTWSPSGGSACFVQYDNQNSLGNYYYRLMRTDVSVSNGVPVGSNVINVCSFNYYGDSTSFQQAAWCPNSSNNTIAFTTTSRKNLPFAQKTSYLELVSATGGTPSVLYSDTDQAVSQLAWSPDGNFIAVRAYKPWGGYIKVIDMSGNVRHTYGPISRLNTFEYARTSGKIAYTAPGGIYTLDTASGNSTLVRAVSALGGACWSPTDWKMVYANNTSGYPVSTIKVATGDTARIQIPGLWPNWKR